MICSCPAGGHVGPPLQLSTNVSVIVQNVAIKAKPPPQSAKADSFFWRKRQPFCHFVTFPLAGEFPIAYAMGEPLKAVH